MDNRWKIAGISKTKTSNMIFENEFDWCWLIMGQIRVERSRSAAETNKHQQSYSLVTPSCRWCVTGENTMTPSEKER
ncbi:hypothetical protein D8T51_22845, partial [Vibrio vulnificus]